MHPPTQNTAKREAARPNIFCDVDRSGILAIIEQDLMVVMHSYRCPMDDGNLEEHSVTFVVIGRARENNRPPANHPHSFIARPAVRAYSVAPVHASPTRNLAQCRLRHGECDVRSYGGPNALTDAVPNAGAHKLSDALAH